jgi:HD-like signal output (HDOD) protein
MSKGSFGLAEVAHVIGSDATLATDVLRCANSAFYSRGTSVRDLTQAITRVGAQQVTRLVLAASLACHPRAPGPLAPIRRIAWIESLASAVVAQELARLRRLRPEEAFLLGLLHDFGKIVACAGLERLLSRRHGAAAHALEPLVQIVEQQHVALGAVLADRWKLPRLVSQVIASHHAAGPVFCDDPALLDVVRVTDEVVALLTSRCHVGAADLAPVRALKGLEEREVIARVLEKIPEVIAAFEKPEAALDGEHLAPPAPALAAGAKTVRFGVTVVLARPRAYTAEIISEDGLVLSGSEPLPASRLVEATLHGPPAPFRVWALTRWSRPRRGAYQVELRPLALRGVERMFWENLRITADA